MDLQELVKERLEKATVILEEIAFEENQKLHLID